MRKQVVLDPGHGTQSENRSPDGTFREPEFALDMAERMRAILARHGVEVTMTRTGQNCPTGKGDTNDLAYRCRAANAIQGLDLFVSLHSNANGSGGWDSARGWCIYTSGAGAAAGRNIAANKIISRVKAAGVKVRGAGLVHEQLYVLKNTVAPAVLIEHGFHTNREDVALLKDGAYREKLAQAQCMGILDYLGVAWKGESAGAVDKPWYADDQAWVQKTGISDGTRPEEAATRAEVWAMMHRSIKVDT